MDKSERLSPWLIRDAAARLHAPLSPAARALHTADTGISMKGAALVHMLHVKRGTVLTTSSHTKWPRENQTEGTSLRSPRAPLIRAAPDS